MIHDQKLLGKWVEGSDGSAYIRSLWQATYDNAKKSCERQDAELTDITNSKKVMIANYAKRKFWTRKKFLHTFLPLVYFSPEVSIGDRKNKIVY